jgi:hypothetical protein
MPQCGYCEAGEFVTEEQRDWHWLCEHDTGELSETDANAAWAESRRRFEAARFDQPVHLRIPYESAKTLVELEHGFGTEPGDVDPGELVEYDRLHNLINYNWATVTVGPPAETEAEEGGELGTGSDFSTPTGDNQEPARCGYCEVTFASERARNRHWYDEHSRDDLTDDEWRRAVNADVERRQAHTFGVRVPIEIPRATWAFVVERYGGEDATPADLDPEDVVDYLHDFAELEFDFSVAGR